MPRKKSDPTWWPIVGLPNILLIEIPAGVYFQAGDETSRTVAALVMVGGVFALAIADFPTVFLSSPNKEC
jgi:hypothetical protein